MTNEERIERDHELDAMGDALFNPVPCDHPEACSTDDTYPGWTPAMGCVKAPATLSYEEMVERGRRKLEAASREAASVMQPKVKRSPLRELWDLPFGFKLNFVLSALWFGFGTSALVMERDVWEGILLLGISFTWGLLAVRDLREAGR